MYLKHILTNDGDENVNIKKKPKYIPNISNNNNRQVSQCSTFCAITFFVQFDLLSNPFGRTRNMVITLDLGIPGEELNHNFSFAIVL